MITAEVYYIDKYMEEVSGASGSLDDVAAALAQGVWDDPAAAPGDRFRACRIDYAYVPCQRQPDGSYAVPEDLPGEIHAATFGEGEGWAAEMIVYDLDGTGMRASAAAMLAEVGADDVEYLACIASERPGTITLAMRDSELVAEWEDAT